jgi:hypothetical protein
MTKEEAMDEILGGDRGLIAKPGTGMPQTAP